MPVHTFTGDDALTIRIGSALFVLFEVSDLWRLRKPDPVVWDPISLRVFVATSGALAVLGIANIFWAGLGMLQALALALLTSPAGIFFNFVREMGRPSATARPDLGD